MENGIEKEIFEMVPVVAVIVVIVLVVGLSLLVGWLFDLIDFKTYDFRQRVKNAWRTRHMPKLVVWENLNVTAVARRDDYRRAVKRNRDVKYPVVHETVTFADPYTTYEEILTRTQPRWYRRDGISGGTKNDLRVLLANCVVERHPMFVPFTSFAFMNNEQQLRTFMPFWSAEEARQYLLWKDQKGK